MPITLIVYTREDFVARVKEITGGKGVDVVYDFVGQTTFLKGFDCLQAARHDGKLRSGLWPRRTVRSAFAVKQRLAVSHAAIA